jgi:hypothetical protein
MFETNKKIFLALSLLAVITIIGFFSESEIYRDTSSDSHIKEITDISVTSSENLIAIPEVEIQPPEIPEQKTPLEEDSTPASFSDMLPIPSDVLSDIADTFLPDEDAFSLVPRDIDVQSLTGIQCNYKNAEGNTTANRGSGVFIHSSGYILTNRHLVDRAWTNEAYDEEQDLSFVLEDCDIRFYGNAATVPSDAPDGRFFELGIPDFKAVPVFFPNEEGLSDTELKRLDYAILRVTKKNENKYLPYEDPKIHPSPVFLPAEETVNEWVFEVKGKKFLALGFPFQGLSANPESYFQDYRLFSKEGTIVDIYGGDSFFLNLPFLFKTEIEPDAYGGRSGSPIFYKGYVVGVFMTVGIPPKDASSKFITSTQLSISAISHNLGSERTRQFFEFIAFR